MRLATCVATYARHWQVGRHAPQRCIAENTHYKHARSHQCLLLASFFGGGGGFPPQKKLQSPQTAAKLCVLNLFFGRDNELQICHGKFLLTDNKRRKLFVIKRSIGCKFMPKMHQNTFGGRASRGPAGKLMQSPDHLCRSGSLLLRGGEVRDLLIKREGLEGKGTYL